MILALALALCPAQGVRVTCLHDGDSLVINRERLRLANIDAPELKARCPYERAQALRARNRLHELLQRPFLVEATGQDRYGRTLVRIRVDGRDVGEVLVGEGLARPYAGGRKPWCPAPAASPPSPKVTSPTTARDAL